MRDGPKRLRNDHFFTDATDIHMVRERRSEPFPLHWHEFFELTIVYGGSGTNVINGEPIGMRAGSVFLLSPADFHEIIPDVGQGLEYYNLIFPESAIQRQLHDSLFRNSLYHHVQLDGEQLDVLVRDAERLLSETHGRSSLSQMVMKNTLELLLITLIRNVGVRDDSPLASGPERSAPFSSHAALRRALVYIHHHYRESLTLSDAAGQANLSANYFSEVFRQYTGVTFQIYVQMLRLEFARNLLASSDLSVTEVCHTSGFNTLPHFERAFKRYYGKPPREFIRRT